MNIKAVLFDMDGLIFDTEGLYKKSWQHAVSEQGLQLSDEYYKKFIGVQDAGCERLLQMKFAQQLDMPRFRLARDRMLEAEMDKGIAYKNGFKELFAVLKSAQLKCALVTSSALPKAEHHFAGSGYISQFDALITAEKVENGKPAPDCYLMASEQLGIAAAECLVLEDSNNGMRAALDAGCYAVMVPDLLPPDADVAERAVAVVASLADVEQFL
ncbi:HAD family hydrolase [Psychromonas ossibalaenae]|uniref:HAD family hydrolase n=1 Tax=Psychromonas ossibalaenae TaxID=444922 RepID=UPI00035C0B92|nr:HAD family phosphatase [Psychromonas ossibalaenae]